MLHRHAGPAVAGNYLIGAASGALLTTTGLLVLGGLLSPLPPNLRVGLAVSLLAILALRVVGLLCLDLPQRAVQIPRETFTMGARQSAFRFAFELGMGVRTYITATSPYALAVLLVLAAPQTLGSALLASVLAAVGYGCGRSVVVVSQAGSEHGPVEHPAWALRLADIAAVAIAFAYASQTLIQV